MLTKKRNERSETDTDERLEAIGEVAERIRETLLKYNISADEIDELLAEARHEVFARHYPELEQRKAS
jgi:hypothetical protein